jgi:hypothetical protein
MPSCPECLSSYTSGEYCPRCDIRLCRAEDARRSSSRVGARARQVRRQFRLWQGAVLIGAALFGTLLIVVLPALFPVQWVVSAAPTPSSARRVLGAAWIATSLIAVVVVAVIAGLLLRPLKRKRREKLHAIEPDANTDSVPLRPQRP